MRREVLSSHVCCNEQVTATEVQPGKRRKKKPEIRRNQHNSRAKTGHFPGGLKEARRRKWGLTGGSQGEKKNGKWKDVFGSLSEPGGDVGESKSGKLGERSRHKGAAGSDRGSMVVRKERAGRPNGRVRRGEGRPKYTNPKAVLFFMIKTNRYGEGRYYRGGQGDTSARGREPITHANRNALHRPKGKSLVFSLMKVRREGGLTVRIAASR